MYDKKRLCLSSRWGLRRRQLGWLGLYRLHFHLLCRDEDRVHGVSFHARGKFHQGLVTEFADEAVEDVASQVAVRHLASLEAQTGLDLVAFVEEADGVVLLGLEIVLVHVDAELDLFERDVLLRLLGSFVLLALLVEEFSVILNTADRRDRSGRNLHQVET